MSDVNTTRSYPLDNDSPHATVHHAALAELLDPFSTRRTSELLDLRGKRCLEVGAGGGRFAVWLAEQVGPAGYVLATDLNPVHVPRHPNLRTVRHDLTGDEPLGGGWDFIHARLTLAHLPPRRQILHRLAEALKPGGVLLVEDWDASRTDTVLDAPNREAAALYTHYQQTVGAKVFAAAGTDRSWARDLHAMMVRYGLSTVDTVIHASAWTGGSAGTRLVAATLYQLYDRLIAAGMTAEQLAQIGGLLDDPRLVLCGHPLYSTSGRRDENAGR